MELQGQLAHYSAVMEEALSRVIPQGEESDPLWKVMAYSLLGGGKRIRPVLTLACCELCGGDYVKAIPFACAVEMIHTYSLIHDDLPCMDDDDLRRGKPTNHKVFGEAMATLAGDALLTLAFETALDGGEGLTDTQCLDAGRCLSRAAGPFGMVAGQVLDMTGESQRLTRSQLERLQALKTGALIGAAVELGCIAANAAPSNRETLAQFAQNIGLAFQIQDDLLDAEGSTQALGKPVGSDVANEKSTFYSLEGAEYCREQVGKLTMDAIEILKTFPEHQFLLELTQWLAGRQY